MNAHAPTPREMHRPEFPAVVHAYTDALQVIARSAKPMTHLDLASATDRVSSNVKRDMHKLAEAGVVHFAESASSPEEGGWKLTAKGERWVAGIAIAEGGAPADLGDLAQLHHAQILPDPLNPRRDFETDEACDELDALRQDILQNGLLQNLVVRLDDALNGQDQMAITIGGARQPWYRLISGERRYRAIKMAIEDGDWPLDRPIPCKIVDTNEIGHRIMALAENLQRRNLNPIEEARAYKALSALGLTTQDLSERVSVTQRQVQMRLKLLELEEPLQERMTLGKDDPEFLSVSGARILLREVETPAEANPVRPEAAPPAAAMDSPPPPVELAPQARVYLAEIAHAVGRRPAKAQPLGPTTRLESQPYNNPDMAQLENEGMVRYSRQWPVEVTILRPGVAWLAQQPGAFMDPDTRLRGIRQDAGLVDEDRERLEADGLYMLTGLNVAPEPEPETLSDADVLVLLELLDYVATKPKHSDHYGAPVRFDHDTRNLDGLPGTQSLRDRRLIEGPFNFNYGDGYARTRLSTAGIKALTGAWPGSSKPKVRTEAIAMLRGRLALQPKAAKGKAPADAYVTPWLNGPITRNPAAIAREKKAAEDEAARVQAKKAAEERHARLSLAVTTFETDAWLCAPDVLAARFIELLNDAGAPAPWRVERGQYGNYRTLAANGGEVTSASAIANRLQLIALNIAAGVPAKDWPRSLPTELEPGSPAAEGDEDLDRSAFEAAIATALTQHGFTEEGGVKEAAEALSATLEADGIEFGDENHDWTKSDAEMIAADWAEQPLDHGSAAEGEQGGGE